MDAPVDDVTEAVLVAVRQLSVGDADRLRAVLHPQLRWTTSRGDVLDRDRFADGPLLESGRPLRDPVVVVVGDTAVLTALAVGDAAHDGAPARYGLRTTQTWVRTQDGWQCLSGHVGPRLRLDAPAPGSVGIGDRACRRCHRPVTVDAARYALHEQMHWSCFHDEFEHEGDPDAPCADPSCPARVDHPSPPPTWLDGLA